MVPNLCLEGLAALWVPGNAHSQDCGNQKHYYLIFLGKVKAIFYNPRKNWRRVPEEGKGRQMLPCGSSVSTLMNQCPCLHLHT